MSAFDFVSDLSLSVQYGFSPITCNFPDDTWC